MKTDNNMLTTALIAIFIDSKHIINIFFSNFNFGSKPDGVNFRDDGIHVRVIIHADDGPIADHDEEGELELLISQKRLQRQLQHGLNFLPRMRLSFFHL